MEVEFDDYDYKNISKKIRLSLKQKRDSYLSPWELSSFVSNFNTYYYKAEVLNTIGIALKMGISPKNILIFDESFKLSQQYNKLTKIGLNGHDLQYLYTLGKPISLFPNEDIFLLQILFKYFRDINEFLFQVKAPRLLKSSLYHYFELFKSRSFDSFLDALKENSNQKLKKVKLTDRQLSQYKNIFLLMEAEYKDFMNNNKIFINYSKHLLSKDWRMNVKTDDDIYKKYYLRFYSLLANVQRPVVAVYNEESKSIRILCRAHINKKQRNAVTLNLDSITHNSPFSVVLDGGIAIITGVKEYYKTYKEEKRLDEIHEQNIAHQNKLNELELIEKKRQIINDLELLEDTYELDSLETLDIPFLQEKFKELEYKNFHNTENLLSRNNFEIDTIDILNQGEF